MTNKFELYKCSVCGNVIEILISGDGHPVCCGQEMEKLEVKNDSMNSPALTEKHSPKIEYNDEGRMVVTVSNHPMEEEHFIMFMQTISKDNNEACIKYFYPKQEVYLEVDNSDKTNINARSYCNIHGLYVS